MWIFEIRCIYGLFCNFGLCVVGFVVCFDFF